MAFLCGEDAPTSATVSALAAAAAAGATPILLLLPKDELSPDDELLDIELSEFKLEGNTSYTDDDDNTTLSGNDTTPVVAAAWSALGELRRHVLLATDTRGRRGGGLALYEAREGGGWRRAAPLQALRARPGEGAAAGGAGGVGGAALLLLLAPLPLALVIVLAALVLR